MEKKTFTPAIYYSSPVSASNSLNSLSLLSTDTNANFQQIYDLMSLFASYLRHPAVAFDMYVHEIVMRLIGTLFSSFVWLHMKKLDKMIETVANSSNNNNNNNTNPNAPSSSSTATPNAVNNQAALVDSLAQSLRWQPLANSQAESATGLTYAYAFTFNNSQIKSTADSMFVHCMRMLCVMAAVIDESALPSTLTANLAAGSTAVSAPPPPQSTSSSASSTSIPTGATPQTSATASSSSLAPQSSAQSSSSIGNIINNNTETSPSFIRSKLNNITELRQSKTTSSPVLSSSSSSTSSSTNKSSSGISLPSVGGDTSSSTSEQSGSSSLLPKTTTNVYLGYFQSSSHYLKLYETTKLAYNVYKKSPQIGAYDRFTSLLKQTLHMFAQLLESSLSVHEVGPHLDEILLYLRVLFTIEPSCTVKCVTLCLKSLFGLNLAGLMYEYVQQQLIKLGTANTSTTTTPVLSPSNASLSSMQNNIIPMSAPLSSRFCFISNDS